MRATFILSALAVLSTVAAGNLRRQDEASSAAQESTSAASDVTSSAASDATTTASGAGTSGTPAADPCSDVCNKASTIYATCHNNSNSLSCFCTPDSINGLGDCLSCKQSIGTDESQTEAAALQDSIGGIIQACIASASTSVTPTKVTITATPSALPASQITAPPAARISGSSTANRTSSASRSSASASASGRASTNTNGASKLDMSFAGVLVGALALFV